MSKKQWVVELRPFPPAYDNIYHMIRAQNPDIFETWTREKTHEPHNGVLNKDEIPPSDFNDALNRVIHILNIFQYMHVRMRNLETGEIIPGEALGT